MHGSFFSCPLAGGCRRTRVCPVPSDAYWACSLQQKHVQACMAQARCMQPGDVHFVLRLAPIIPPAQQASTGWKPSHTAPPCVALHPLLHRTTSTPPQLSSWRHLMCYSTCTLGTLCAVGDMHSMQSLNSSTHSTSSSGQLQARRRLKVLDWDLDPLSCGSGFAQFDTEDSVCSCSHRVDDRTYGPIGHLFPLLKGL